MAYKFTSKQCGDLVFRLESTPSVAMSGQDPFVILFREIISNLFGIVGLIVIVCCLGRPRGI